MIGSIIGAVIMCLLVIGPLGFLIQDLIGVPDLLLISAWIAIWLFEYRSIPYLLTMSLLLQYATALPVGFYLVWFGILAISIVALKKKYLVESNVFHGLFCLALGLGIKYIILAIYGIGWVDITGLWELISTFVCGLVVYYLIIYALKLQNRWFGQKIFNDDF